MNLPAVPCMPSAQLLSSSPRLPCWEASSPYARRSFNHVPTTRSTVSRVGKPAAIADGRGPRIDFGLRHPRGDVGFCCHEVVEHSWRLGSVADRCGGSRTNGEGRPSLASCLHPAHWVSGFLSRQEPDVCSFHDDPCKLEIKHASC